MTTTTRARKPRTPPEPPPDALVMAPTTNGAEALRPSAVEQVLVTIDVGAIKPSPLNPRRDLGDLDGLAASITAVGILEPLIVEWASPPSPYVLIAGHRRLAAARLAGLTEVPCLVRRGATTVAQRMEMALVENLQREGLSPLDEADGFAALVHLGLSQRAIAERLGCSQALVSKRLALLELPSHVQARITKGTLPIEAAVALTKLVGHPDKLKKAAGEDPSAIVRAVEQAEKVVAWEAKRDELVTVAKGKGWPVVDEPSWSAKRSFKTLAHWNGPPDLDLDARKHEAEPCHAVMIPGDPPSWYSMGVPHATSVCAEPTRHGPKGASSLKAKVARQAKCQPSEYEVQEAKDRQERKAAGAARAAVLADALRSYRPAARPTPELVMVLRQVVDRGGWDTFQVAGELLGLEYPGKGESWNNTVQTHAEAGNTELHRAAVALALAATEVRLRGNYGSFSGPEVAEHYAYLATLGYQPSPWEQAKLDEAAKAAAGADD